MKRYIVILSLIFFACNPIDIISFVLSLKGEKKEEVETEKKIASIETKKDEPTKDSIKKEESSNKEEQTVSQNPNTKTSSNQNSFNFPIPIPGIFSQKGEQKVDVIPWQKLQSALPKELEGWEKLGELEAGTIDYMGISVSHVKQTYKQGDRTLSINIVDTTFAPTISMFLKMGRSISVNTPKQIQYAIDIKGNPGFISLNNETKSYEIVYMIGDRFLVEVEITGSTTQDELKEIAGKIDIPYLLSIVNMGKSS